MDATLNTVAGLPTYVLVFLGIIAFLYVMHKQTLATAVQAESVRQALAVAATAQTENNRLRDESNKAQERWQHAHEMMNERFLLAITGQTAAIGQQSTRLTTMDTSLSSLPKLAAAAEGSDAKTDLIVAAIQSAGVDIQAVNRKLGYMGVDMKSIAQYIVNPTAPNKQDVQDIANKPATTTQEQPAVSAVPTLAPGNEIKITGTVVGTGIVEPAAPETAPA